MIYGIQREAPLGQPAEECFKNLGLNFEIVPIT